MCRPDLTRETDPIILRIVCSLWCTTENLQTAKIWQTSRSAFPPTLRNIWNILISSALVVPERFTRTGSLGLKSLCPCQCFSLVPLSFQLYFVLFYMLSSFWVSWMLIISPSLFCNWHLLSFVVCNCSRPPHIVSELCLFENREGLAPPLSNMFDIKYWLLQSIYIYLQIYVANILIKSFVGYFLIKWIIN